jgi:hypothetical protein
MTNVTRESALRQVASFRGKDGCVMLIGLRFPYFDPGRATPNNPWSED